jgi:hypothetical protein
MRREILLPSAIASMALVLIGCGDSKPSASSVTASSTVRVDEIPVYDQIENVFIDAGGVCNRSGKYTGPRDAIVSVLQDQVGSAQDAAETDPASLETVRVHRAVIDAAHVVPAEGMMARVRCHSPDSSSSAQVNGDIWTYTTGGSERVFLVQVNDQSTSLDRVRAAGVRLDVSHYRD